MPVANAEGRVRYQEWFSAQQPLLGDGGLQTLQSCAIFIAGADGIGSNVAVYAARAGFQRIVLCDGQEVELDNLNRIFASVRHLGSHKVGVVEEFLTRFDRRGTDPGFSFTALAAPVEHASVEPYLRGTDYIIASANSASARRWLVARAKELRKTLINVGFSCSPGEHLGGEVSIFRPSRTDLGCPVCISPDKDQPVRPPDPLFFPPVAVLAGLAVNLLVAEATNFDRAGEARENYFVFDGLRYSLTRYLIAPNPNCTVCQAPQLAASLS